MSTNDAAMKRVGFFGISPSSRSFYSGTTPFSDGVPVSSGTDLNALLEGYDLTDNKGNMLHGEAPAKIFNIDRIHSAYISVSKLLDSGWSVDRVAETFSKNFDYIVFSTANIIRPDIRHESTGDILDKLTCGFIVLGVGVQDGLAVDLRRLDSSLVRLLDVCNRKARIFGVRGETTKRWLHAAGFTNAKVLGCPSLYVYPDNILSINPPTPSRSLKVVTGGYLAARTRRSSALIALFRDADKVHYVMQEEMAQLNRQGILKDTGGIYNDATGEVDFSVLNHIFSEIHDERMPFKSYRWFQSPASWRTFASSCDVCISDRLHGAVAALQSGVPTVLIADDDRVREIADLLAIPSLGIAEIESSSFEEVVATRLDHSSIQAFKAAYQSAFTRFRNELAMAGVALVSTPSRVRQHTPADSVKFEPKPLRKRSASIVRKWLRRL